jgi:hypothetical protein
MTVERGCAVRAYPRLPHADIAINDGRMTVDVWRLIQIAVLTLFVANLARVGEMGRLVVSVETR